MDAIERNKILIEKLARLSSISSETPPLNGAVTISVEGGEFLLQVSHLVDLPAERARLLKTIKKHDAEIKLLKEKLSNKKFMTKAPKSVISDTRIRLTDLDQELIKLSSGLKRLNDFGVL